ncbi:hypothetical protein ALC56_01870 [Trachymyrmex septentrionalis]|uniref:Uncharacterized protein n=1 Tax=Trachymyrmex septentrionalis TaxID=34720 RepID=A0A195FT27_9HYME|nr:hypothetical protein ALC56_01870 [Trachymyrmex septentrionalis]
MIDVLAKTNILPGNKYTVQNYLTGIQKILNKKGQVMCVVDQYFTFFQKTKNSYVNEIRICFNKALQLVDCDGIYHFPTNCNRSQQIIYPNIIPHHHKYNGITGYIIPPSSERSRLLRVLGLQVKEVPYLQEKFLYTKYVKYNHNNNELSHYS